MNIIDVLKPFKKRLTAEACLKSAVPAGVIASCVAIPLGILHMLFPWMVTRPGIILSFVGVLIVSFALLFFLLYRPSGRDTARRLDSLGLSERVETMLEYEHSTTPAANLQRKDTLERLQTVTASAIRFRISKTLSVLCAVFFVCATVLLFLPEVNAFSRHPIINALRATVADSNVSEEFKEDLEAIIDELEEKLEESENGEGKPEDFEHAKDQISESVDREVTREEIGEAMKGYEDLRELGEAIEKGDREGVSEALDKLKEQMTQDPSKKQEVADQLQSALEASGAPEDNDLREALEQMKENLQNASKPTDETMQEAESDINDALEKQENAEQLGQEMQEQLENAKPITTQGQKGEGEQGAGQEGSNGQGEKGDQGKDQAGGGQSGGEGEGQQGVGAGGADAGMDDVIHDPQKGSVSYGSVYAAYFAEFLSQADAGELPDHVVEAMNAYLENLKNQNQGEQ